MARYANLVAFSVLGLCALPLQAQTASALDWLKGLTGRWEGSYEWSGARSGQGDIAATYHLTGAGSAVVEDLAVGSQVVMTSVYHRDGDDLRMTHYCAAANQPRLKATEIDEDHRLVRFDLVDITNLATPTAGHVHKFEIAQHDETHLTLKFTFVADGKESYELVELRRAQN